MSEGYYTASELEELTGTPAGTWMFWAARGEGPVSLKLGRRRVWRKDVVRRWLKEQETQQH